jgi:fatty acid desaturase
MPSATPLHFNSKEIVMKTNEGAIDRSVRVVAGLILIGLAYTGTVGLWGYIGVIPLITGVVGMCPLYSLLGINSCPMPRS